MSAIRACLQRASPGGAHRLDYAGILLEFVWNAPAMGIVALPSICSAGVLPWWGVANAVVSILVLGSAAGLVRIPRVQVQSLMV